VEDKLAVDSKSSCTIVFFITDGKSDGVDKDNGERADIKSGRS
jgi:hypothetical protein